MDAMNRRGFARTIASAGTLAGMGGARANPAPKPATGVRAPFRISVMLWTVFQHLPFEERLEKVAQAGYHSIELVGEFKRWSAQDFRNVSRKKRTLGLGFDATSGLTHGIVDPSERSVFLAEVRAMLPILERLECPALIALSGNRVPGLSSSAQHQSCIDGLKHAAEIIEGKNLRLLVENIDPKENPRYYLTSAAEGFEIIRAVNHPQVKFLYDLYHEQVAEGNLIEKLEKNIDFTGLVHVADVPGRHEPGTGEIDYGNIFKTLAQLRYDRFVAMEYLPTYDAVRSLRVNRERALREGASGAV
jgi:hydroxypyruvate isomerase